MNVLEAWFIVVGGIVGAVVTLTIASKLPGGKWLFNKLVRDPIADWIESKIDRRVIDEAALQKDIIEARVRAEVASTVEPLVVKLDAINDAVNNVRPGEPPIKEKVHDLREEQKRMKQQVMVMDGKLDLISENVTALVGRK